MSQAFSHSYQFGEFTVDGHQKILLRHGVTVTPAPKVFDTLMVLVENGGRIVEKEALMNRVWPDKFVEEANLAFVLITGFSMEEGWSNFAPSRTGEDYLALPRESLTQRSGRDNPLDEAGRGPVFHLGDVTEPIRFMLECTLRFDKAS